MVPPPVDAAPAVARAPATIDPAFEPAIEAIRSLNDLGQDPPLGDVYLSLIERLGVRIVVGPLPPGVNARYTPVGDTIVVSAASLNEDPRTIATVLVHELTHVGQVRILGEWAAATASTWKSRRSARSPSSGRRSGMTSRQPARAWSAS